MWQVTQIERSFVGRLWSTRLVVLMMLCFVYACESRTEATLTNTQPLSDNTSKLAASQPISKNRNLAPVTEMLAGLEQRLRENPNDIDGWILLAKSYHFTQQPEKSDWAIKRAREAGYQGEDPVQQFSPESASQLPADHPPFNATSKNNAVMQSFSRMLEEQK